MTELEWLPISQYDRKRLKGRTAVFYHPAHNMGRYVLDAAVNMEYPYGSRRTECFMVLPKPKEWIK